MCFFVWFCDPNHDCFLNSFDATNSWNFSQLSFLTWLGLYFLMEEETFSTQPTKPFVTFISLQTPLFIGEKREHTSWFFPFNLIKSKNLFPENHPISSLKIIHFYPTWFGDDIEPNLCPFIHSFEIRTSPAGRPRTRSPRVWDQSGSK